MVFRPKYHSFLYTLLIILSIGYNFKYGMKTLKLARLFGLLSLILLFSCKEPKKISPAPISWYSDDPVSIPFRTRLQKFERTNLVDNNSFESGKIFVVDTAEATFRIDGWQKVGNNVHWVNIEQDSIYSPDEAVDSIHSIKINREKADETDNDGEGIISDFIKVIPGNYSLSFYVRLDNVCSNKGRLGTKLYDAINIRVYFFDKNKIPVSSRLYLPHKEIYIDNSFKGSSFSNFWQIEKFGWNKVIGKSHNYVCPEGNIPDDARYVKLFFGFKGTGTVWFDNINFHYTKSNFTSLERMQMLTDTIYSKHEVIIPSPKKIQKYESIIYYKPGNNISSLPVILVPDNLNVETRNAAQILKSKIENLFNLLLDEPSNVPEIKIVKKLSPNQVKSSKIIFSIGKNVLYDRFKEILPLGKIENIPQSYFIYTNSDMPNIIFLAGDKAIGDYYAATTAVQLFDNKNFIFHNAKVIDYPDFKNRFYHLSTYNKNNDVEKDIAIIDMLTMYKLNGAYISNELSIDSIRYKNIIGPVGTKYSNSDIFKFKMLVAPVNYYNYITGTNNAQGGDKKYYSNAYHFSRLKKICRTGFNAGAEGIAYVHYFINPDQMDMCSNSYLDKYLDDADKFYRYINNLNLHLKSTYPGKKLEILLPFYNNEYIDNTHWLAEIFLDYSESWPLSNITYYWSGSSYHSLNNDNADLERMTAYLNKAPIYWDNSLITVSKAGNYSGYYPYYPGKLRLYNIFEPYNDENIKVMLSNTNKEQIFFNGTVNSELELIKFATIADFSWNTEAYDSDISLWKVLLSRYGSEAAWALMFLNDQYCSLMEVLLKMKLEEQSQKLLRKGESIINDLNMSKEHLISLLTESHPLIKEISCKIDLCIEEINEVKSIIEADSENITDNVNIN